jgi:hypothetical protein
MSGSNPFFAIDSIKEAIGKITKYSDCVEIEISIRLVKAREQLKYLELVR